MEIEELRLQISGRPEEGAVQTFAPNRANQPFNEGMREHPTLAVVDGLGLLEDFSLCSCGTTTTPSSSATMVGAANSTGGVMVKMIDAQFIVVSSSATHQQGNEAAIFKAVFWHSIVLASLVGLIVMFYAYVIPWAIP